MKSLFKNAINKTVSDIAPKAEDIKHSASAGWDKASELAKEAANNAAEVAKGAVAKASEGVNTGVDAFGEKVQRKKAILKATDELDSIVKSIDASINSNMDAELANQLRELLKRVKELKITVKKDKKDSVNSINIAKADFQENRKDIANKVKKEFNRVQLQKHYTNAIQACEEAYRLLKEVYAD